MLNIPRSEFIDKLRKYADDFKLNGVLRVTIQGKTDLEECFGYADINTKEAIKPDSVFAFYSLSKPFCAIGMHLLKQNGSIDLDKHPSTYVPELKGLHNGVTIRKMLHHNSGIPDISPSMADTSLKAPSLVLRSALNNLCKQDMQFTPGEGYNYINANFSLCALIAENVTGMPYCDFIQQNVLEPLGTKTARVYDDLNPRADMVNGMELLDGKLIHVPVGTFGMLGAGDISGTVDDVYRLNRIMKDEYKDLPIFLFGHSMGSFLSRIYALEYPESIDGIIIHGTGGKNPLLAMGKAVIKILKLFRGDRHRSKLVTALAFGSYNSTFPKEEGKNAWLTRDVASVAGRDFDPRTSFIFTLSAYGDLFFALGESNSARFYSDYPTSLPTLIMSGEEDPVGNYGKGPREVYDGLKKRGVYNLQLKTYEGARHELFNEINKAEVFEDIAKWLEALPVLGENG